MGEFLDSVSETVSSQPNKESTNKIVSNNELPTILKRSWNYENIKLIPENEELADDVINLFGEILNRFSREEHVINENEFHHQNTLFCFTPQFIKAVTPGTPNIQILYGGGNGPNVIGHWICTYYDGARIHIYDSLNNHSLKYEYHRLYLKNLYPHNPDIIFHEVQQQPNSKDCGLFAIAFAVSLYFKKDPENTEYAVQELRPHLRAMVKKNTIEPFPCLFW